MEIAERHGLLVIEDAAQGIDSSYKGRPLGSIGHMACFSFHETKNIQCGEGGLLAINHPDYVKRAEILWEKGTNRQEFFRGEVNKYGLTSEVPFCRPTTCAPFCGHSLRNLKAYKANGKSCGSTTTVVCEA